MARKLAEMPFPGHLYFAGKGETGNGKDGRQERRQEKGRRQKEVRPIQKKTRTRKMAATAATPNKNGGKKNKMKGDQYSKSAGSMKRLNSK